MKHWANTTTKGTNYDVTTNLVRLPVAFSNSDRSMDRVRPQYAQRDTRLRRLLEEVVQRITVFALPFVLFVVFFAVANAITGQAQETEAGHSSAWMGEKLAARDAAQ